MSLYIALVVKDCEGGSNNEILICFSDEPRIGLLNPTTTHHRSAPSPPDNQTLGITLGIAHFLQYVGTNGLSVYFEFLFLQHVCFLHLISPWLF